MATMQAGEKVEVLHSWKKEWVPATLIRLTGKSIMVCLDEEPDHVVPYHESRVRPVEVN
jgi:hypothetical protein